MDKILDGMGAMFAVWNKYRSDWGPSARLAAALVAPLPVENSALRPMVSSKAVARGRWRHVLVREGTERPSAKVHFLAMVGMVAPSALVLVVMLLVVLLLPLLVDDALHVEVL